MKKEAYFRLMGLDKTAEVVKAKKKEPQKQKKEMYPTSQDWQIGSKRKQTGKVGSELFGGVISPLALATLSAILGASMSDDKLAGAAIGAGTGYYGGTLANIIGGIAGLAKGNRTPQEQTEYNAGSTWKNYLIPGVGMYNTIRTGMTNDQQNALITEKLANS